MTNADSSLARMVTFVYNIAITYYGYGGIGLAAYLIIGYLMLIILTIFLGMAEGLQPVFSHFAGTGETERSSSLRRFSVLVFLITGAVCYLLIILFSHSFFCVFAPGNSTLVDFATEKSLYYFWGYFFPGYNILMISFWQSTGNTGRALAVSLSRSAILPPLLAVFLPRILNREAVWSCQSASEMLTAGLILCLLLNSQKAR